MIYRTDRNNNPTAFTIDIANQAGLILGQDYEVGEPFTSYGVTYYTAKLLGDPLALTRQVISKVGFYTQSGSQRWIYIGMPDWVWNLLGPDEQNRVIGFMYSHEGGTEMKGLFV